MKKEAQAGLIGKPTTIRWESNVKLGLPGYSSVGLSFSMEAQVDEKNWEQAQAALREYVIQEVERAAKEEMQYWKEELG